MPAPKGLGAVYLTAPEDAGARLREVITAAQGDLQRAGRVLRVQQAALHKWLARFPGGPGYASCRDWLDATYPQRHDPRKIGRRRGGKKIDGDEENGP